MIVKFLCRFAKDDNTAELKELEKELDVEAIINPDFDKNKERELRMRKSKNAFDYGPMTLNLRDVATSNIVDKDHTCLRMYNGQIFVIKLSYEKFEHIYQTLTGFVVTDFTAV